MRIPFHCLIHSNLDIPDIIQRIKNADDIDSVFHGILHKLSHHIIRIVMISQYILSAQKHLKLRIRHCLPNLPQTLPRIFI